MYLLFTIDRKDDITKCILSNTNFRRIKTEEIIIKDISEVKIKKDGINIVQKDGGIISLSKEQLSLIINS